MQLLHFHKGWVVQFLQPLAFEGLVKKALHQSLTFTFSKIGAGYSYPKSL
jgi:hypothetical protein